MPGAEVAPVCKGAPLNRERVMETAREYYKNFRPEMMAFVPARYSKVLEVGCAEGNFSTQLQADSERWGIEMDKHSAQAARGKLTKVLLGSYDEVVDAIPDDYFDLIICNDVIEHMSDHDWFLTSIRTKLRSSGVLIASLPNVRHIRNLFELLVTKEWRYRSSGILDRTHLRFFTYNSIVRTFREHDFVVEQIAGINQSKKSVMRLIAGVIWLLTASYYSDIQYPQFAVRVRKP